MSPLLQSVAAAAGLLHGAPAAHWLPVLLVARARGWEDRAASRALAVAACFHLGTSAVYGAIAGLLGARLCDLAGSRAPLVQGWALAGCGLLYSVATARGWIHGHLHHPRTRFHEIEEKRQMALTPRALSAIHGLNPCLLSLPLAFASGAGSPAHAAGAAAAFSAAAWAVGLLRLRQYARGGRRVVVPVWERAADPLAGLLVAASAAFLAG